MQTGLTTNKQYQPMALAGFFSWLKRAVNNVIKAVGSLFPRPVFQVLDDFTNGDGLFTWGGIFDTWGSPNNNGDGAGIDTTNRIAASNLEDFPLSSFEQSLLDQWTEVFIAFIKPYLQLLDSYKTDHPTVRELGITYNKVQRIIAVLRYYKDYTLTYGETGFSQNAVKSRNEFLRVQIGTLNETLNQIIQSYDLELTPTTEQLPINGMDYEGLGFDLPERFVVSTQIFAVKQVEGNEVDDDNEDVVNDTVLVPTQGSTTLKLNYKNTFLLLLAAYGAKKLIFK